MNRSAIKKGIKNILPRSLFDHIFKIYIKCVAPFFNKRDMGVIKKYEQAYIEKNGLRITDGPFAPMEYIDQAVGSSFLHKLAGYYESVLHPFIEEIRSSPIKNILDIGAAEGYYTTGFGKMFPEASIAAFEIDDLGKTFIQKMHEVNHLHNPLTIHGEANSENILPYLKPDTLLICDCEGAEKNILDIGNKDVYKNIRYGIIELHDEFVPGCREACTSYFKDTHDIEIIKFVPANPQKFSFLKNISSERDISILLRERGLQEQEWMLLRLKQVPPLKA